MDVVEGDGSVDVGLAVPQAGRLGSWYNEVMKRLPHISVAFPAQG